MTECHYYEDVCNYDYPVSSPLPALPCWAWETLGSHLASQTFIKNESHPLLLPELLGMLSIKN